MTRRSSCGPLSACLLVCMLLAAQAAAGQQVVQQAQGPRTYYELDLERALGLAREHAPSLRVAQARVAEARARGVDAQLWVRDNPTLEVGGGARVGRAGTTADVEIGVGQVFELGGQRGARIGVAQAEIDLARATADEASRRLLQAVAEVFLRARHAEERRRIAQDAEALAVEIHQAAQRRQRAGDVEVLDVNLASLALARAQAQVRRLDAARARSLGDLRALLGLTHDVAITLTGDLLARRHYSLTELLARALDRPDRRAVVAATRVADAEVRLGEARAWPDLGIRLGYAREEDAHIALAALTLTLPFFDHGQGLVAAARARGAALRAERESIEGVSSSRLAAALDNYRQLLDAVEQFERDGLLQVAQSDAVASRSYALGAMPLGELLSIRRELVEARVTYTDLLLDAALARVALEAEAGVLR